MKRKRPLAFIGNDVTAEIAALGYDDAVWVVSCLGSLASDPETLSRWAPVTIVPMPEAGAHCVRIEMRDEFSGWSAVAAIKNGELVVLLVKAGISISEQDAVTVRHRYAKLHHREITEPWPDHKGGSR